MPTVLMVALAATGAGLVAFLVLRGRGQKPAPKVPAVRPTEPRAAPPGPRQNWLLGRSGPVAGKAYHLGSRTATIGRAPTNFIQIEDPSVSRVHAQLDCSGPRVVISGFKDGHAVIVNGQVIDTYTLQTGDEVAIGSASFRYEAAGEFGDNAGLGRKAATTAARAETRDANSAEFQEMLRGKLEEANWDVAAAAKSLGVEPDFLEQLIKLHGMQPPPSA